MSSEFRKISIYEMYEICDAVIAARMYPDTDIITLVAVLSSGKTVSQETLDEVDEERRELVKMLLRGKLYGLIAQKSEDIIRRL